MSARLLLAAAVFGAGCADFDAAERLWCDRHPVECDGGAPGGGGGSLGGGGGATGGGGGATGGGGVTGGGGGGAMDGGGMTGGGGAIDGGGMTGGGTGRDAGWSQEPAVTIFQLRAVWGSGPDQRWAVGYGGTILRGGGGAWTAESGGPSDSYRGLWGRAEGDGGVRLWAVGFSGGAGVIRHRSAGTWNLQTSPGGGYFNAVWGTDAGLWVVGENGIICQSNDGTTWSRVDSGVTTHLRAVWGSAANDVWAAGETTLHWDGTSWTELDAGPGLSFYALWGNSPGALWGAANGSLYRLDGGWLLTDQLFHSPLALWGSSENDLWITGNAGELSHWNGVFRSTSFWTLADGGQPALHGIWGSAPDDLWVVGTSGTILHGP